MNASRPVVALLLVTTLLTGCASAAPSGPSPTSSVTASPTASPTPTPTPTPQASALIISLDGLTIVDTAGGPMKSALFTDADGVLALVSGLMGSTPEPTISHKTGSKSYEWHGVEVGIWGTAFISITQSTLAGLTVRTPEGIQVGSSRAEVVALGPTDIPYDGDGDGDGDSLGIEQRPEPQHPSLTHPGDAGTSFLQIDFDGDTVSRLRGPAGDFYDI